MRGFGSCRTPARRPTVDLSNVNPSSAPGIPGLSQINVQVPDDPTIAGQVPVFVGAVGMVSNRVTVFVQP
jgi:uncharacterized protein (TIGR03437 family)